MAGRGVGSAELASGDDGVSHDCICRTGQYTSLQRSLILWPPPISFRPLYRYVTELVVPIPFSHLISRMRRKRCVQRSVLLAKNLKKFSACLASEHAAFHRTERARRRLVNMEAKIGSLHHIMQECGVRFPSRSPLTLRQHKQRCTLFV